MNHSFFTKSKKSHRLLISSKAMRNHMRMFDRALKRPKAIVLVTESHRNTLVIMDNTWSTSVDLIEDKNVSKFEY